MRLIVDIEKRLGGFRLKSQFEATDGLMGILGASGSGKSMTLKCIGGIVRPTSGHIELDGVTLFDSQKRIDLPPQKRKVGYLFQNYALFPNMTVRQNILCGLHAEKCRATRESELCAIVKLLGLGGLEGQYPHQLSGGQQQRAALARILVSKPKLLMLDEPFSALDTHLRERLQVEMKALLRNYGGPSIMVTHSRDEAYRLCERIALMKDGSLLSVRPTKELFADPRTIDAASMTGCKNIAPAERIDEHTLLVPSWGVTLQTAFPVREGVCAVGIRAHYLNTRTRANRYLVKLGELIEEPFELTYPFRFAGQDAESNDLWWRLPKEYRPQPGSLELGVAPDNVLPLYPEDMI